MVASASSKRPRRSRFAEDVAAAVRESILTGEMVSGQRIDQDALAESMAMSRLPVREALIALEQEGLVINTARRGSYVAAMEPEDVLDQYEVYGVVAGLAAARAAERLDADDIHRLAAAHQRFVKAKGGVAQQRANEEFHRIINRSASHRLRSVLGLLARSLPSQHYHFDSDWGRLAGEHHERILHAIERRDAAGAQAAMVAHLRASGHEAVVVLRGKGLWGSQG
jgi:DNA-binding GntR family transcriptional regulator